MRSPIAEATGEAEHYSDMGVMRSAAGHYIGTFFTDPENGLKQPGTRDSEEYYKTVAEAMEALENGTFTQRKNP